MIYRFDVETKFFIKIILDTIFPDDATQKE